MSALLANTAKYDKKQMLLAEGDTLANTRPHAAMLQHLRGSVELRHEHVLGCLGLSGWRR